MPAAVLDTLVRPKYLWVPEHASTAGAEAADLAESAGLILDAEQRLALDALLAERADGRWVAFEAAVICARQNLKTVLCQAIVLADLYLFGSKLVVWTAHHFDTTKEAMRDILALIDGAPHLSKRVKRTSLASGEEGIELTDGQRVRFKARTKTGGRGLTGDRVILDEAFALSASEMGSLLPAMSAKSVTGAPQVIYASSAGMVTSDILRNLRDRGRRGDDPSLVWVEWCSDTGGCAAEECDHHVGATGCALDDPERWREANPAMGRRISVEHIATERRALPPSEFARERLGWWEDPVDGSIGVPLQAWAECVDRNAKLADPLVFAVDVAPNGASSAIVACGGPLEVVEHRRGTGWVVDRLVELRDQHHPAAIGLDPAGPVGALISDIENAGLEPVLLEGREAVQACGSFHAAVLDHELVHRDQAALNDAIAGGVRRQVGDAWKWSRRDSTVDICPLVAATVARFLWVRGSEGPADFFLI